MYLLTTSLFAPDGRSATWHYVGERCRIQHWPAPESNDPVTDLTCTRAEGETHYALLVLAGWTDQCPAPMAQPYRWVSEQLGSGD